MAKVEIYTKNNCPFCEKAKMLFDQLHVTYTSMNVSTSPEKMEELFERRPSARTFPQIFINDEGIGGCDDLYALHEAGELQAKLDAEATA